jgi:hypothetical protein
MAKSRMDVTAFVGKLLKEDDADPTTCQVVASGAWPSEEFTTPRSEMGSATLDDDGWICEGLRGREGRGRLDYGGVSSSPLGMGLPVEELEARAVAASMILIRPA